MSERQEIETPPGAIGLFNLAEANRVCCELAIKMGDHNAAERYGEKVAHYCKLGWLEIFKGNPGAELGNFAYNFTLQKVMPQ